MGDTKQIHSGERACKRDLGLALRVFGLGSTRSIQNYSFLPKVEAIGQSQDQRFSVSW